MSTTLPFIDFAHKISINISPNEADLAITSINSNITEEYNINLLNEYGYTERDIPKSYNYGFTPLTEDNKKSIIFVDIGNNRNVSKIVEQNLYRTLEEFRGWFQGKKVWIPLMGTKNGLTLEESYTITVNTINRFQKKYPTGFIILLSIPQSEYGSKLFELIQFNQTLDNPFFRSLNFIEENNINFYVIENNIERQEDEIWYHRNEKDISFEDLSKIKKNDIVLSYISNGTNYLKIKSLGIIVENISFNNALKIDWKIKNISIDIEDIIYARHAIQKISKDGIIYILSKIKIPYLGDFILFPNKVGIKEKIAGLISDSDDGLDYLEIDKDVNAFAKVIAAKSFEPPLAIALFGKWGSGKSFFMNKLKTRITKLSEINNIYCKGVVQIHFNAWSYMDSNLWASIVTRIFEELNIYISDNTLGENEKKMVEQELTSHLSITKEEISILNNKKQLVKKEIDLLKRKRKKIQKDLSKKISQIKSETIWNVIENVNKEFNAKERILKELNCNQSFSRIKDDIEKNIPEEYLSNPEKAYEIVSSRYTFLKEFFKKDKIFFNLIWLIGILAIIILFPILLDWCTGKIKTINFIIPQATLSVFITLTAVWKRAENVYKDLKPLITSFWNIKEQYEKKIEEATIKYEKERQVLIFEIKENKSKILIISEQIQNAERKKTDIEFRINNALATETLYSFIDKRSKSNDYQKHLGIISIIRKDFEILSDLFIGHHKEIDQNGSNNDFKSKFKKPLERIILYIDDLDRCPEENVVQVLEAVNLLMAFPLFVVVVGVDSRWVKNALHKKHISQFDNSNKLIEVLEVSNYLEKIFQIPFHLKDANDNSVKHMIKNLAQNTSEQSLKLIDESLINVVDDTVENDNNLNEVNTNTNIDYSIDLNEIETSPQSISVDNNTITEINSNVEAENLILTDDEIQIMQDMSEIIGNNPRCIKRFVNIFRIIKVHEEFAYSDDSPNQEIIAILFLIALPLGKYKKVVPNFESYIADTNNDYKSFNNYFKSNINIDTNIIILKREVDVILSDKKTYSILQNMNCNIFKKHNDFIKRFTFSQLLT